MQEDEQEEGPEMDMKPSGSPEQQGLHDDDGSHRSNVSKTTEDMTSVFEDKHDVVFTVTIAIAVPTGTEEQLEMKDVKEKRVLEAPHAQNYYHLEYSLIPDYEPMKVDVVTYGLACKIYMEEHEARVVKTWQEGDFTWIAWSHSLPVTVTRELLLSMFNHTVELRVWDTKDKCSSRARFDRPKAFRLPQPRPGEKLEDVGGVKALVTRVLDTYISMQPNKRRSSRALISQSKHMAPEDAPGTADQTTTAANKKASNNAEKLAEAEQLGDSQPSATRGPQSTKGKLEKGKAAAAKEEKDLKKQVSDTAKAAAEQAKKFGICMVPLRLALLFGDRTTEISRLDSPVAGIQDIFLSVSLDTFLLSHTQKADINPMMIQICCASDLPASPVSFADLRQRCLPIYCKYKFLKEPDYVTAGKDQEKKVFWNETNVVLLGTMDSSLVREYLNGPGMEVEVHDRDRKPDQMALKPKLFGDDLEDEKISNVGTVESRRTLHNPFHGRNRPWDPYGVARVDFSELLLGQRFLELSVPILNCPIPDVLGIRPDTSGKIMGVAGAVDGPVDCPFSAGHYVRDSSMLKLKISLACPLVTPVQIASNGYISTHRECPFNRIIFMFDYHNIELLNNLQTVIMGINARALSLDTMPQCAIDVALSMYKLSIIQHCRPDLDIVTGFHVMDGVWHIFVLEGLRDKGISVLWDTLPQPQQSDVRVLYNSDLSFSRRLYGPLDVDLCRIKLHQPLSVIVQEPLLYVRDMVLKPCYDALMKLDQIMKTNKMKCVIRNNLFPTAEMVVSLSRELGVILTEQDVEELRVAVSEEVMPEPEPELPRVMQERDPDASFIWGYSDHDYNRGQQEHTQVKDYIQDNIKHVHALSRVSHKEREKNKKSYLTLDIDPVYNYSGQQLNSTEAARDRLRQYLQQQDGPNARYTYNYEYMSAMFCPVDMEQERKEQEAADRARWMTRSGWTNPGRRNTREMAAHPLRPDSARVCELKQKWVENILHANKIKPTLERDHYLWCNRRKDFELYAQPAPANFGSDSSLSVAVSAAEQAENRRFARIKQLEDWRLRVVVDDVRQYFHRVLPATEMTMKGCYSSNQLDRLKGLLKDPIRKTGFAPSGCGVDGIPALAVMGGPYDDSSSNCDHGVDGSSKFCGLKPGELPHSWTHRDNQIPRYNYQHHKFAKLRGHDFNAQYRSRSKLSRRSIQTLVAEERDNHLFRAPFSASPYSWPLPPVTQPVTGHISNNNQEMDKTEDKPAPSPEPMEVLG